MRISYLILGLAAVAAPASAQDWYLTAQAENGNSISFVDRDSINPSGEGLSQARVYIVENEDNGETIAALDALVEFDCTALRRRYYSITGYDHSGAELRTEQGSRQWRPVVDGSQDASSREFVCSGGRSLPASRSQGSTRPFAAGRALLRAARGGETK